MDKCITYEALKKANDFFNKSRKHPTDPKVLQTIAEINGFTNMSDEELEKVIMPTETEKEIENGNA